ncbi:hypothetical protein [Lactococcus lactis]|uniref:hypothetical protein n=1 Tax=Lactococcus lactis TaxID=1358 RepID=UPI0022DEA02A|nr:hypothetical protein [Lactococcus lactis]
MTQETAKERIYREALEEIKRVCDTQDHVDNHLLRFFITKKMMEIEKLPATTDKLSIEKLQERCDRYEKVLTEIAETKDFYRSGYDHWEEFSQDALKAQKALAAIGGDDD